MANEKFLENVKHSPVRWLYTLFLAILIALFFGLGVSAFYPAPQEPELPAYTQAKIEPTESTEEQKAQESKYEQDQRIYQEELKGYSRNASMIILALAVISLVIALTIISNIDLISDALLLGGLITLIYSIIRGFMAEDPKFRFAIVSVGLVITVVIGYLKFIKKEKN